MSLVLAGIARGLPLPSPTSGAGGAVVGFFQKKGGGSVSHPLPIKSEFGSRNIFLYLCGRWKALGLEYPNGRGERP